MWPFAKYLCFCCLKKHKPSFKLGLKRSLRKSLGIKVSKSDRLLDEDPYLRLGFGITAYFDVMVQLLILFSICTMVMIPLLWHFSTFDALSGQFGYFVNRFSLGNMGGSHT